MFDAAPAVILAITLVALFVLRASAVGIKLLCEAGLLVVIGWWLVSQGTSPLPSASILHRADAAWLRALAAVWWLIAARMVAILIVIALGRDARSREATLASDLLACGIYVTAVLIILNSVLGLRVNGLLATSGVIAIVIGLALQNTLADVFSGIAVQVEQPFRIGDHVAVGDYTEGRVVQMNWRSVRIETDGEDVATIPNSIVAKSNIVNRSFPTERRAVSLEIPTKSAMRAERLMELLRHAALLCPDVLEDPAPSISIKELGTRVTKFAIGFHVAGNAGVSRAKGQLLRQARRMFRHAGVADGQPMTPVSVLESLGLFESLAEDQIRGLADASVTRSYPPDAPLFEEGDVGASLFVIRSGILAVTKRDASGRTESLGRVGPGEYLGEISMMTGERHPVTVTAATTATVLELPRSALESLLREDGAMTAALAVAIEQGMTLLDRDDAARPVRQLGPHDSLLVRIRRFLMTAPVSSR